MSKKLSMVLAILLLVVFTYSLSLAVVPDRKEHPWDDVLKVIPNWGHPWGQDLLRPDTDRDHPWGESLLRPGDDGWEHPWQDSG